MILALAASMLVATMGTASASHDFDDVPDDHTFHEEISWLVDMGITQGFPDNTFRPALDVTRQAYMAFLYRAAGHPTWAGCDATTFPDVDADHPFCEEITWGAEMGITQGYADGTFKPGRDVTRQAAAAFQYRAAGSPDHTHVSTFTDVTATHPFHDAIAWMDGEGIAEGYPDGTYKPGRDVTRQAAAAFLMRHVEGGHPVEAGPPAEGNQTFTITPSDEATNPVSTDGSDDSGAHQYSGDVSGETVSIALFDADDVNVDGSGNVTFDSNSPFSANSGVSIEVVNGTGVEAASSGSGTTQIHDIGAQTDGTVAFTIDSVVAEQVIPVVWVDADDGSDLDLDSDGEPTEDFGVGGQKNWQPPEATLFDSFEGTVREANTDDNWYTLDTGGDDAPEVLVNYESGDDFEYSSDQGDSPISMAQFEEWLSVGDVLDVDDYNPGQTGEHTIDDDIPMAPQNLVANATDSNEDGANDTIELTWDAPTNPDIMEYNIQRAPVDEEGEVGTFSEIDDTTSTEYDDMPDAGTYAYRVTAENGQSFSEGPASDEVQATVESPAGPTIESAELTLDTVTLEEADASDVWTLEFDQAMDDTGMETFTLEDEDGDIIEVSCDPSLALDDTDNVTAANCEWQNNDTEDGNETLVIELREAAEDRNATGDGEIIYPLTITDTENVYADGETVDVNLADSADTTIN